MITMINHLLSPLSSVSQPGPSQEVQIWQITISVSWQRQETWLVTVVVKVCTQGLYTVCQCCYCETGFAVKLKGQKDDIKAAIPLNHHIIISVWPLVINLVKERGALRVFVTADFNVVVVVYSEFIQACCFVCCSRIWNRSNWNRGPLLSAPGLLKQQKKRNQLLRMRWRGELSEESCDSFSF